MDYDDVVSVVDYCIKQNLVDPSRVVVGGWSQGGFMSYVCTTRNGRYTDGTPLDWKFRGTICGAGVTDWDMMAMTSDVPNWEAELGASAPWEMLKTDTRGRKGSVVWEMKESAKEGRMPPCLILHGKEDVRVPVTQAWAFQRGCKKWGVPCEMVIYPREPHVFAERGHILDMAKRVLKFVDIHLA